MKKTEERKIIKYFAKKKLSVSAALFFLLHPLILVQCSVISNAMAQWLVLSDYILMIIVEYLIISLKF